ncbi:MAG: hypothetical protein ACXVAX_02795, partial [Pseudobdellovibrio sp.]
NYGSSTEETYFTPHELEPVEMMADGSDMPAIEEMQSDSGYSTNGMQSVLTSSLSGNAQIDALYKKYAALRSGNGLQLPSEFGSLVQFIKAYIVQNSKDDSEKLNGITNDALAVQIVRASFCFGNDPFMIASKIRRETSFLRTQISSGEAVGWSQMTSSGIKEVQDQLSGNSKISAPNALSTFQQGIRCFTGIQNYRLPVLTAIDMKKRLREKWALDLVFGQVMMKALVSYVKASNNLPNTNLGNVDAYRAAFEMYNGDTTVITGRCIKGKTQMKYDYACDAIDQFNKMSAQWSRFIKRGTGKDLT